jgi:hypothetical protein
MPKRRKPVYGKALLWQPEVAFIYLAVTEQYPDCIDALEAAAGAVQNLTACEWKVWKGKREGEGRREVLEGGGREDGGLEGGGREVWKEGRFGRRGEGEMKVGRTGKFGRG